MKVLDQVINYIKNFQKQGFKVEYAIPEDPEMVLVHIPLDRRGIVLVEAKQEILNDIKKVIENN